MVRVLAHFVAGEKVTDFLSAQRDWLDVRFCAEELPGIREILWFSMQPEARGRLNMHLWPQLDRVRVQMPAALDACVKVKVAPAE